jgi:hypothetical protein
MLCVVALALSAWDAGMTAGGAKKSEKSLAAFVDAIDPALVAPFPVNSGQVVSDVDNTTIDKINSEKPDVIFVGNSMLLHGIDIGSFSQLTGYKTMRIVSLGSMDAWQFAVVKNVIGSATHKPKFVVLTTRHCIITTPNARASGQYRPIIDKLSGPQDKEKVLFDLAYGKPAIGFPDVTGLNLWDFQKVGEDSFLPYMLRIAKDQKYTLVIARHRNRPDQNFAQHWGNEQRKKYTGDLKAYIEANGGIFLDYVPFDVLKEALYGDGDHLNAAGMKVWTAKMAEDIKELSSPARAAAISAAAKEKESAVSAEDAAKRAEELKLKREEEQKLAADRAAWEAGKLLNKVGDAVRAGKEPAIHVAAMRSSVKITKVDKDGTLGVSTPKYQASLAWARLTAREKAALAVAVASDADAESCALAAFYLLGLGDRDKAEPYLAKAGAQADEVRSLFK